MRSICDPLLNTYLDSVRYCDMIIMKNIIFYILILFVCIAISNCGTIATDSTNPDSKLILSPEGLKIIDCTKDFRTSTEC